MGYFVARDGNLLWVIVWRVVIISYWLLCKEGWLILWVIVWQVEVKFCGLLCGD